MLEAVGRKTKRTRKESVRGSRREDEKDEEGECYRQEVVAFSSQARILGKCATIHSPPAFFLFLKWSIKAGPLDLHGKE